MQVISEDSVLSVSADATKLASGDGIGFRFGDKGTHTSRTIMMDELTALFRVTPPNAARSDYRTQIVEHNCLGKRTVSNRKLSDQRMSELYALDPTVLLFRLMRHFWEVDSRGRPLLALLLALARDPLMRLTAPPILHLRPGEELGRQALTDALNRGTGSRFNDSSLDKIVRNTAASWTQSGHLVGRSRKTRQAVHPTPEVVTYAMLLGYILGARGNSLLDTLWTKVLDVAGDELIFIAMDAKRMGYLDLKVAGGVVEARPDRLLTDEERRLLHGPN